MSFEVGEEINIKNADRIHLLSVTLIKLNWR
jgi:hypothetical protein